MADTRDLAPPPKTGPSANQDSLSCIDRRNLLGAGAALSATALIPSLIPSDVIAATPASSIGSGSGPEMLARANALLGKFTRDQRKAASFAFGSAGWKRWNYMRGSAFSPGVPLEKMTADQKTATMDLLASALSATGLRKAQNIMLQQDILRDHLRKGSRDRNRERFSVMFFGTPDSTGFWGWRFEGHHLSLSFTLDGSEVISLTPNSFSSEPNTVTGGPHKGLVALPDEERLGRLIFGNMSTKHRGTALIRDRSFGNVLTTAGNEGRISDKRQGIPLADLPQAQVDLVKQLLHVFVGEPLAPDLAAAQTARLAEGDLMATHFGWAGDDRKDGASIYYRLHSDTFLIEFASLFNQPLHLHTAVHDVSRNLGRHRTG